VILSQHVCGSDLPGEPRCHGDITIRRGIRIFRPSKGRFPPVTGAVDFIAESHGSIMSITRDDQRGWERGLFKQYSLTEGLVSSAPVEQTPNTFPVGSTPSYFGQWNQQTAFCGRWNARHSSASPGTHPVFLRIRGRDGFKLLYDSAQAQIAAGSAGLREQIYYSYRREWKVYVGTQNELDIYGLLPESANHAHSHDFGALHHVSRPDRGQEKSSSHYHLSNLGPGNLIINSIALTGYNPTEFTETNTCDRL